MIVSTLAKFEYIELTCLGLVLFVAVFMGALSWVYRPGSTQVYKKIERLPLEGDR